MYLNKHKGETCVIIGNGPSLRDLMDYTPEFLDLFPTFGTNRIYLRHMPDYYVAINPLVIEQNRADIQALPCAKFIRHGCGIDGFQLTKGVGQPFSYQPDKWVNEGYTVTHVCLQLAYWMGFTTALLVGVDHRYIYEGKPNETQTLAEDPNHFDPDYFAGQTWQTPDLKRSETYYRYAKAAFEANGRRVVNCTPDTDLDVFEKGDVDEWLDP